MGGGVQDAEDVAFGLNRTQFQRKREKIVKQFLRPKVDVAKLRHLAIKVGGLLSNDLRIFAWPKLLDVESCSVAPISGRARRFCL